MSLRTERLRSFLGSFIVEVIWSLFVLMLLLFPIAVCRALF